MPRVKLDFVASFSSEDPENPANNLLEREVSKKRWLCGKGETSISVVLQLARSVQITAVHIGVIHSALVEVLVGRSETMNDPFKVLVPSCMFLNPIESRKSEGLERVRSFSADQMSADVKLMKWDRVRVVCSQPYNKHCQFGLSFIHIFEPETASIPGVTPKAAVAPSFLNLDMGSSDEDDKFRPGELFAKHIRNKSLNGVDSNEKTELSTDTQIRRASSQAIKNIPDSATMLVKTPLSKDKNSHRADQSHNVDSSSDRKRSSLMYDDEDAPHKKIDKVVERHQAEKAKQDELKKIKTKDSQVNLSSSEQKKDELRISSSNDHRNKDRHNTSSLDHRNKDQERTSSDEHRNKNRERTNSYDHRNEDRERTSSDEHRNKNRKRTNSFDHRNEDRERNSSHDQRNRDREGTSSHDHRNRDRNGTSSYDHRNRDREGTSFHDQRNRDREGTSSHDHRIRDRQGTSSYDHRNRDREGTSAHDHRNEDRERNSSHDQRNRDREETSSHDHRNRDRDNTTSSRDKNRDQPRTSSSQDYKKHDQSTSSQNHRNNDRERSPRANQPGKETENGVLLRAGPVMSSPHSLLAGVVFTMSGYVNPRRGDVRDKALAMGARCERDWTPRCTHLICAFANTPKLQTVRALPQGASYAVATADWVEECCRLRRLLPWQWFATEPRRRVARPPDDELDAGVGQAEEAAVVQSDCDTDDEIEKVLQQQKQTRAQPSPDGSEANLANINTDKSPERADSSMEVEFIRNERIQGEITLSDSEGSTVEMDVGCANKVESSSLPNFLEGLTFVVDGSVREAGVDVALLTRHICAYGGEVIQQSHVGEASEVSYVLCCGAGPRAERARGRGAKALRADWLWRCHEKGRLCRTDDYLL